MMKIASGFLFLVLLLVSATTASPQESLGLSEAIETALGNNYDIRIIERDIEIAETNDSWGAAGRLPTVSFDLTSSGRTTFADDGDTKTAGVTPALSLNWLLFNGYAIGVRKEKLETLTQLSKGNAGVLVEQTVQAVILAYYTVLLEQERLTILKEVMSLSQDRYEYTQTSKEIGSAVTYDVLQAKNAWLEDKAAFLLQEVTVTNAVRDLNYLMGVAGEASYTFSDKFTVELNDYELPQLLDKMRASNKTLKNQYLNQVLLEKETALAKSLFYPTLALRSGIDAPVSQTKYGNADWTDTGSQGLSASLILSYSLFDGGSRKRALGIAKIEEDIGRIGIADMEHSLTIQLAKLFDLYNVRKNLFQVAEENLDTARLNLQISEDKFRAGTIDSFNFRDVQLIYLRAALSRLQAIFNLIDSDTALARITGGILTER